MEKGCRVRFLNQTGGGIVNSVDNGRCVVIDDDGWEWTMRLTEVVEVPFEPEKEKSAIEKTIGRVRQEDGKPKKRTKPADGCQEIDLHAESLCREISSPIGIHVRQLQTIRTVLDREKYHIGKHIVFIHGKGDGTLRSELIAELNSRKAFYEWEDAPFDIYGYKGALKVTVKSSRKSD